MTRILQTIGQGNFTETTWVCPEHGDEEITAIVNLSIDPATGNTIGKIWYDDQNSTAFNGNDGIVYIKGVVSAAPSSSEPYGRFDISVVEQLNNDGQYAVDGERLSSMRIIATGHPLVMQARRRGATRGALHLKTKRDLVL